MEGYFAERQLRGDSGCLLLRGVVGERDALLNVALETGHGGLQKLLLLVGDVTKNIDGFLGPVGLETRLASDRLRGSIRDLRRAR